MNDYSIDGEFGKLRKVDKIISPSMWNNFFCASSIGWHLCNDKYVINRLGENNGIYLIIYTIGGCGIIEVGGAKYELKAGSIMLILQNVDFSYYTKTGELWEFYWIHPSGIMAGQLLSFTKPFWIIFVDDMSAIVKIFEELIIENSLSKSYFDIEDSLNISLLLHKTIQLKEKLVINTKNHMTINSIIQYLEKHYSENIDLDKVSEIFCYSKIHIIRLFNEKIGMSPYHYLIRLRIKHAENMIKYTSLSIKQISYMVGFNQPSNFIKKYKDIMGYTPFNGKQENKSF